MLDKSAHYTWSELTRELLYKWEIWSEYYDCFEKAIYRSRVEEWQTAKTGDIFSDKYFLGQRKRFISVLLLLKHAHTVHSPPGGSRGQRLNRGSIQIQHSWHFISLQTKWGQQRYLSAHLKRDLNKNNNNVASPFETKFDFGIFEHPESLACNKNLDCMWRKQLRYQWR